MLYRIGGRTYTQWYKTQEIASFLSFHTKIHADRRESLKLIPALEFISKYNEETTNQILNILNNSKVEDMKRYNVTKARILKIARYRTRNGPFKSLDEVLEVDDFGAKILEKFVASIAKDWSSGKTVEEETVDCKRSSKILNTITTPSLLNDKRLAIKTVTSFIVGTQHISWAKIDISGRVSAWNSYEIEGWPKKDDPIIIHDLALKIRNRLPNSDVYVTEEARTQQPLSTPQPSTMMLKSQQFQLTTILIALLATQFNPSNGDEGASWMALNNIYVLQKRTTARLFRLLVGQETASAHTIVDQIMSDRIPESLEHVSSVIVDPVESIFYERSDMAKKEALSRALLTSLAFVDLAVNRNPRSLTILNSGRIRSW